MADKFDGNIVLKLEIDSKTGKATLEKVNQSLEKTDKHLVNINKRSGIFFTHFQKSLIVLNQAAELVKKIAQFSQLFVKPLEEAATFERYRSTLKNLIGDINEADSRFKEMVRFAAATPFDVPGIIEAGNRLQALGKYSLDTIRDLGDLAAASGRDVMQAVEAYTNLVTGRTGIAIKQFRAMLISTRDWERTIGKDVLKMGAGVKASISEMLDALPKIIREKNFAGLMEEQTKTFFGMLANMKDKWQQVMASIGDTMLGTAKNGLTSLNEALDWLLVNIDAVMKALQSLGEIIVWLISVKIIGGFIKSIVHLGSGIINAIKIFNKARTAAVSMALTFKTVGVTAMAMGKAIGISMNLMLGLVGIIATLVTMASLYSDTVNKSVGDLIRYNEQLLTNTELEIRNAEATLDTAEAKKKLLSRYIELLDVSKKSTEQLKEFNDVQIKIKRGMPYLADGTYRVTRNMEELNTELIKVSGAAELADNKLGDLKDTIREIVAEMNNLKIQDSFQDFITEFTEGGGSLANLGKAFSTVWDAIKPTPDKIDDFTDAAVKDFFGGVADEITNAKNYDELTKVYDLYMERLRSEGGLSILPAPKMTKEEEAAWTDTMKKLGRYPKSYYDRYMQWADLVSKSQFKLTTVLNEDETNKAIVENGKKVEAAFKDAYMKRWVQIGVNINQSSQLVSDDIKKGIESIQKSVGYSGDATKEKLLEYKSKIEDVIKEVRTLPDELGEGKGEKGVKIGNIIKDLLPPQAEMGDEEYAEYVINQRELVNKLLEDETRRIDDLIDERDKMGETAVEADAKNRRKWLKVWQDKRKAIDAEMEVDVVKIESNIEFTEEEKAEQIIARRMEYQAELLQLQTDFENEYNNVHGLSWAKRNGDEKKYSADLLETRYAQTEEQVGLYERMYEQFARIREVGKKSAYDSMGDMQRQMESFKTIIVKSLGAGFENVKFEDLTQKQLEKIAPAFLEFFAKLQKESADTRNALAELINANYAASLIAQFENLDTTNFDNLVASLNESKEMILLNGLAVDDLKNAIIEASKTKLDLSMGDVAGSLDAVQNKTETLSSQLETMNAQRMASISLIKDEEQRGIARAQSDIENLKAYAELYKNTMEALQGEEYTPEEQQVAELEGEDVADQMRADRLKAMKQYEAEYLNTLASLQEAQTDFDEYVLDLDLQMWQKRMEYAAEFVGYMQGIANALVQMAEESVDKEIAAWKKYEMYRLDLEEKQTKLHARTRQQEERVEEIYQANKEAIEKEADRKKYERMKGWFNLQKALEITMIAISTAGAVMKNIEVHGQILGSVMNILTIAQGAAQAALVASKQMPAMEFKSGGYTGDGNDDDEAGTVHKKEFVVNAPGTKANRPVLEKMNKGASFKEGDKKQAKAPSVETKITINNEKSSEKIVDKTKEKSSDKVIESVFDKTFEKIPDKSSDKISSSFESSIEKLSETFKESSEKISDTIVERSDIEEKRYVDSIKLTKENSVSIENDIVQKKLIEIENKVTASKVTENKISDKQFVKDAVSRVETISSKSVEKISKVAEKITDKVSEKSKSSVVEKTNVTNTEKLSERISDSVKSSVEKITNIIKPSLVGKNTIIDIRKDMELSQMKIDNNGQLVNELVSLRTMMKKYLDNPVAPSLVVSRNDSKKIVNQGVVKTRRDVG